MDAPRRHGQHRNLSNTRFLLTIPPEDWTVAQTRTPLNATLLDASICDDPDRAAGRAVFAIRIPVSLNYRWSRFYNGIELRVRHGSTSMPHSGFIQDQRLRCSMVTNGFACLRQNERVAAVLMHWELLSLTAADNDVQLTLLCIPSSAQCLLQYPLFERNSNAALALLRQCELHRAINVIVSCTQYLLTGCWRLQITCTPGADQVCSFRGEVPLATIGAPAARGTFCGRHGGQRTVIMQSLYHLTT